MYLSCIFLLECRHLRFFDSSLSTSFFVFEYIHVICMFQIKE